MRGQEQWEGPGWATGTSASEAHNFPQHGRDPIDRFLAALPTRPRRAGRGWMARCPAHEDRTPSLSFRATGDGTVLIKCHAGCTTASVLAALGLTFRDLFPRGSGHGHGW